MAVYYLLNGNWWFLGSGVVGIVTSFLFVYITQYYTEYRFRPVQAIAKASTTGAATNIISGLAIGMETPALPVVVISAALLLAYYFGQRGLEGVAIAEYSKGVYGAGSDHGHAVHGSLRPGHGYVWSHSRTTPAALSGNVTPAG